MSDETTVFGPTEAHYSTLRETFPEMGDFYAVRVVDVDGIKHGLHIRSSALTPELIDALLLKGHELNPADVVEFIHFSKGNDPWHAWKPLHYLR